MGKNRLALIAAALACAVSGALLLARLRSPAVEAPAAPGPELAPIASTIVTPRASSAAYTNEQLTERLQEETGRMGITGIAKPEEDAPSSDGGFLGEELGRPETRERAEAYIRQFARMRRPFEREREKAVKLPGETAELLGEKPQGGAVEKP